MPAKPPIGVVAALSGELGSLAEGAVPRERAGVNLFDCRTKGLPLLAAISGVGKVAAARAAGVLLAEGARGLLVVGTCGGLVRSLAPGDLVHCTRAFQTDLAVREERQVESHPAWREAWQAVAPGAEGWFLTADRPVITPWRRLRLARAFRGPCVADMETAAVGAVAAAAGLPWAALRVVTDRAGPGTAASFRKNYRVLGSKAADTLPVLIQRLD